MSPEIAQDLFRQLASVSAVLGGFAFASAAAFLTAGPDSRAASLTAGLHTGSAVCFLVCTLTWALGSVAVATAPGPGLSASGLPEPVLLLHRAAFLLFVVGLLFLMGGLGVSGLTRSRSLGIATGVAAGLGAAAVLVVLALLIR